MVSSTNRDLKTGRRANSDQCSMIRMNKGHLVPSMTEKEIKERYMLFSQQYHSAL